MAEQARAANDVLFEQFGGEQFVTGLLVRVDLDTGEAVAVNAGHPLPLLVRGDRVHDVSLTPDPPMGLFAGQSYEIQRFSLHAGDRMALVSDGITKRVPPMATTSGANAARLLVDACDRAPVEVVRLVTKAVMEHRGTDLRDDVLILWVEWQGS